MFTFSQTSGSSGVTQITISATSTMELNDIVENFTLSNTNKSMGFPICQRRYEPVEKYIIFQPNSMSVESSGGTSSLNIQSNDAWEIVSDDWIQLSRYDSESKGGYNSLNGDGNTIVGLRFSENTGSSRNGGISGYCKSNSAISATTTVQQSGSYVKPYLALGQYQYGVESSGQSGCSLAVVSNLDWTVMTDARWITINTTSGSSDGTILFDVQENSQNIGRRATITVTSTTESLFAECTINQSASAVSTPYIIISPTDQTIPLSGGSFTISVSSNTDWDVAVIVSDSSLSRPWISVDKLNGSGDDDVVVTVNAVGGSSEIASRSAYISFYNNKEGLKTECNITQKEPNLTKIYYTTTGGTVLAVNETGWGDNVRVISNTYENGQGVIECDGTITIIPTNYNWRYNRGLQTIILPEGLIEISDYAFDGSSSLESVIIPDSVEIIGNTVFGYKKYVSPYYEYLTKNPTINGSNNHLTSIGEDAFANSTGVSGTLVLGKYGDVGIGNRSFESCTGLTTLYIYGNKSYAHGAFKNCTNLSTVYSYINDGLRLSQFDNVAPVGTFHYPSNGQNYLSYTKNEFPSGWTFINDL